MSFVRWGFVTRAPAGRPTSALRGGQSRSRSRRQGARQSSGPAISRRRTRDHDLERPRTGRHLRSGHLGPHDRPASAATRLRPVGVHRPARGSPTRRPVPAPPHARCRSPTNRSDATGTTRRSEFSSAGVTRSDPRPRPGGRRRDHHRIHIAGRGSRTRVLGLVRCRRGGLCLHTRRPSFGSGQSGQSSHGSDRRRLIVLHEHAVHSETVGGVDVRLHVVEERRLVWCRTEAIESEFVDRRVGFTQAHLVAVDHGVEQLVEVHEQTPAIPEFPDVVGEHTGPTTGGAQIHHEFVHRFAADELEGRTRALGGFFLTRCTHAQAGGGHQLADTCSVFVHRDFATLQTVPRMIGVRSVVAHHHLDHLIGIVVGKSADQVDRPTR